MTLITLVSGQLSPNFFSVRLLSPSRLVLVHTIDTSDEADLLAEVAQRKPEYGVSECMKAETAPFHPGKIRSAAQQLLARLTEEGVMPSEIVLNYTGGTKPMAIQFVEVFREAGAQLLYIDTQQETCWWTVGGELQEKPLTLKLDIPELLALRQTEMPDQTDKTMIQGLEKLSGWLFDIKKQTVKGSPAAHSALLKWLKTAGHTQGTLPKYGHERSKALESWIPDFSAGPDYALQLAPVQKSALQMQVRFGNQPFSYKKKEFWLSYFVGGWFEFWVYQQLEQTGAYDDIRCNVRMKISAAAAGKQQQVKNEVDVLAVKNGTPVFVECKSGVVTQKSITNLKIMSDTYGGRYSEAVLVSLYPVSNPVLKEKIEENGILLLDKAENLPEELARLHEYMLVKT